MAATGFSLITIHSNFTYDYTPNSNLIQSVTGPVHTVTNTWEPSRDVLDIKQNKVGTDIVSKYEYAVNAIGQRTGVTTSGSAFPGFPSWLWGYDHLGQVVSADSSVSTSDRAYEYDAIGNRKKSANSLTLPGTDNYSSNALNQYTAVDTLSPAYDFDGNATAYPLPVAPSALSGLGWDGENRLISSTVGTTTTTYLYDAQSRRIAKSTAGSSTIYLYDTWNCIAEYTQNTPTAPVVLAKTRLWGTDLSGTAQGAGGVGGLLAEDHHSGTAATFYPTYDGNGNVSEYLAVDGSPAAHFEYDPFGNTVVASGSAGLFDYRFSTKPRDSETGLYYYAYRHYDPITGRWPSRDPIGEYGGININAFVGNDGINWIDVLGLASTQIETSCGKKFDKCNPTSDEIAKFINSLPKDCKIITAEFNGHGNNSEMELNKDGEKIDISEGLDADGNVTRDVQIGNYDFSDLFGSRLTNTTKTHLDGCHTGCTGPLNGSPNNLAKTLSEQVPGIVTGSKGFALGDRFKGGGRSPNSVVGVRGSYRGGSYIGGKFAK